MARTRELLAKGKGARRSRSGRPRRAPFVAEALFNQGVLIHFRGMSTGPRNCTARPPPPLVSQTGRGQPAGDRPATGKPESLRNLVALAGRTDAARAGSVAGTLGEPWPPSSIFPASTRRNLVPIGPENRKRDRRAPWSRALLAYRKGDRGRPAILLDPPAIRGHTLAGGRLPDRVGTGNGEGSPLDARTSGEPRYLLFPGTSPPRRVEEGDLDGSAALLAGGASGKSPPGSTYNNLGIVLAEAGR